jgi:predicted ATPase
MKGALLITRGPFRFTDVEGSTRLWESFDASDPRIAWLCEQLDGGPLAIELAHDEAPALIAERAGELAHRDPTDYFEAGLATIVAGTRAQRRRDPADEMSDGP